MEETKYYRPEIEEFHVGFEYEVRTKRYTSSTEFTTPWVPCIQGDSSTGYTFVLGEALLYKQDTVETLKTCIIEKGIRVKCLDREDIESFGFVWGGSWGCYNKQMWKGKGLTCCLYFSHDMVSINIGVIGDLLKDMPQYFRGKIKNKSELKRVLQQLEII